MTVDPAELNVTSFPQILADQVPGAVNESDMDWARTMAVQHEAARAAQTPVPANVTIEEPRTQAETPEVLKGWERIKYLARVAVKNPIITAETVFPINEMLTYGPPLVVGLLTRNVEATAAAAGLPTLALELAGARAGAKILGARETEKAIGGEGTAAEAAAADGGREVSEAEKMIDNVLDSDLLSKIIPPRGEKLDPVVEGFVALYGGTIAAQKLKEREDATRTQEQLRRYGEKAAYWLGAVCAAEAAAIAGGIVNWDKPYVVGPILAASTAAWVGVRRLKQRLINRNTGRQFNAATTDTEVINAIVPKQPIVSRELSAAEPRYKLDSAELGELETELVDLVKEEFPEDGVVGVWIRPTSKFANFVRTHEASFFGEVEQVSEEDEKHTLFLALVDTRDSSNRIVHGGTVTGVSYEADGQLFMDGPELNDETTGFYTVDELINLGNFSSQEFYDYYSRHGIDLKKCISVETNFVIRKPGHRAERFQGLRMSDLAYLMFFNLLQKRAPQEDRATVFASINKASVDSFRRFGLSYDLLMGREDLVTPESLLGRESMPVSIPYDANNRALFGSLQLPEYYV